MTVKYYIMIHIISYFGLSIHQRILIYEFFKSLPFARQHKAAQLFSTLVNDIVSDKSHRHIYYFSMITWH